MQLLELQAYFYLWSCHDNEKCNTQMLKATEWEPKPKDPKAFHTSSLSYSLKVQVGLKELGQENVHIYWRIRKQSDTELIPESIM